MDNKALLNGKGLSKPVVEHLFIHEKFKIYKQ